MSSFRQTGSETYGFRKVNTPAETLEFTETSQMTLCTEFASTFARHDAVEHVKKIGNGAFGEVHMVSHSVWASLIR